MDDVLEVAATSTSLAFVVTDPDDGVAVELLDALLLWSSALAVATPENSTMLIDAARLAVRSTVTDVTATAFSAYQISMRVFEPLTAPAGPAVQVFPALSLMPVTFCVVPVLIAITAIRQVPALLVTETTCEADAVFCVGVSLTNAIVRETS